MRNGRTREKDSFKKKKAREKKTILSDGRRLPKVRAKIPLTDTGRKAIGKRADQRPSCPGTFKWAGGPWKENRAML